MPPFVKSTKFIRYKKTVRLFLSENFVYEIVFHMKYLAQLFHVKPGNGQISEWAKLSDFNELGLVYGIEFSETSNV